jgi:hypothetical protein
MQTVPQSTREVNTSRPMPYNTVTLQQNQPTWCHTKSDMFCAEARGLHKHGCGRHSIFGTAIGSATINRLDANRAMEIHTYELISRRKPLFRTPVWGQAIRRFAELCLVQLAKYGKAHARASARGSHESTTKHNHEMEPLARIQVRWHTSVLAGVQYRARRGTRPNTRPTDKRYKETRLDQMGETQTHQVNR